MPKTLSANIYIYILLWNPRKWEPAGLIQTRVAEPSEEGCGSKMAVCFADDDDEYKISLLSLSEDECRATRCHAIGFLRALMFCWPMDLP